MHERGQENIHFFCSADHVQDWQPYVVDPYSSYGDRGILFFPVQLTTSRIGNLTRLIHTLLYVMTIQYNIMHASR